MDTFTPAELEQLARSLAMSPTIGDRDRHRIIDALRELARLVGSPSGHRPSTTSRPRAPR